MIWTATPNLPNNISLLDVLGLIPAFFDGADPRPAAEQIAEHYIGGWNPQKGFTLDGETLELSYPGDPPLEPWAQTRLRDERIVVYHYGYTMVVQPDGAFEVSRLD